MITVKAVPVLGEVFCIEMYEDGVRRGYVMGTEIPDKLAYIWNLYVKPAQRRKGYGKALLETLQSMYPIVATQIVTNKSKDLFKILGFNKEKKELVWRRTTST